MHKGIWVVIFAIVVVNVIAGVVFLNGNNQQSQTQSPPTNQPPANQNSKISTSQLSDHDSDSDCWIAYKGKVYDITAFLPKHPGSAAAISPYCGTSGEFEKSFTDQHGTSQVEKLFKEGILKGDLE